MSDLKETMGATSGAIDDAARALDRFSSAGMNNQTTLKSMIDSVSAIDSSIQDLSRAITALPGIPSIVGDSITEISSVIKNFATIGGGIITSIDDMDSGLRKFASSQYKIAGNLGQTFETSQRFLQIYRDIIKENSILAQDGIYIGSDDLKKNIEVLEKAGISIDELSKSSEVLGVKMSNAQMMTAQAKSMGMDITDYSSKVAEMIRRYGLSMEDSMKLMAANGDIAKNTGLRVDEVTSTLSSATSAFQRFGTTVDFGRPILSGFADSVKEVGLGISQAQDLTNGFSQSLMKIVDNPGLAYITSIKGGLSEYSGGGVLNSSIQMQAKMLDQTPGAQADLAKSLSEGIRDTLKSFTGGDIITVKQAAESPELQTKFYTQQQLLSSTYGIGDTATQDRVLEYLANLEEANSSGDQELSSKIEEQIKQAIEANNSTTSIEQQISDKIERSIMIAQEQLQVGKQQLVQSIKEKYGENLQDALEKLNSLADSIGKGSVKNDGASEDKSKYIISQKLIDLDSLGIPKPNEISKPQQTDDFAKIGVDRVPIKEPQQPIIYITLQGLPEVQATASSGIGGSPILNVKSSR